MQMREEGLGVGMQKTRGNDGNDPYHIWRKLSNLTLGTRLGERGAEVKFLKIWFCLSTLLSRLQNINAAFRRRIVKDQRDGFTKPRSVLQFSLFFMDLGLQSNAEIHVVLFTHPHLTLQNLIKAYKVFLVLNGQTEPRLICGLNKVSQFYFRIKIAI